MCAGREITTSNMCSEQPQTHSQPYLQHDKSLSISPLWALQMIKRKTTSANNDRPSITGSITNRSIYLLLWDNSLFPSDMIRRLNGLDDSDLEADACTVEDTYLPPALSSSSVHLSAKLWSWVWIFSRSRVSAVAAILSPSARIISTVGRRSSNSLCSSWRRKNAGFGKGSNPLLHRRIKCVGILIVHLKELLCSN